MAISPAVPSVSAAAIDMGSSVTITHESPSMTGIKRYTITASFGGNTVTLATQTANTTTTWTPATATYAPLIPNAASGTATITCTTYDLSVSSSTAVGSKTCTLTLRVPSSIVPTISSKSAGEGNTSLPSVFSGKYVKGYSKLKLTFTASGAQSSKIVKTAFTFDGKTYSGTLNATTVTASVTSDTMMNVGSGKTATLTVTDSRGRTASTTVSGITVLDYSAPKITKLQARRSNGSTASTTGSNAQRYITATVTTVGTNAITNAVLSWKQKSASVWATSDKITIATSGTAIPSSGSAAWTVIAKSGTNVTFSTTSSYDLKLEVTDGAGNTTTAYTSISTASVVMDFRDGGLGVAFGKLCENDNSLESAWTFRGTSVELTNAVGHRHEESGETNTVVVQRQQTTQYRNVLFCTADNRWYLREWTPGQSTSTNYWEQYALPLPNANSSTTATTYNILTSKNTVTVGQGGTGATTFTSGAALIGNGTGAVTTKGITNNTSTTYINYSSIGENLITANTLAYWNGAYNSSNSSNITKVGTITSGTWQGTAIAASYIGAHAATATTYGGGTSSNYGHVKVSDNYTSSAGAASASVAASSKAVSDVYAAALKVGPTGSFNTTDASITFTTTGTWLLVTGHNSTSSLNTMWLVRVSTSETKCTVFGLCAGGTYSGGATGYTWMGSVGIKTSYVSGTGGVVTGRTAGGGVNVICIKIL